MSEKQFYFIRHLETYKVQDGLDQIDEWSIRQSLKQHYTVFAGRYPKGDIIGSFKLLKEARAFIKESIKKSGGSILEIATEPHHDYRSNVATK